MVMEDMEMEEGVEPSMKDDFLGMLDTMAEEYPLLKKKVMDLKDDLLGEEMGEMEAEDELAMEAPAVVEEDEEFFKPSKMSE